MSPEERETHKNNVAILRLMDDHTILNEYIELHDLTPKQTHEVDV
jgi:hypothetical protein